ncbi:MAG: TIGR03915 family putative DNA repair protein [Mangrovibacterium sp.]
MAFIIYDGSFEGFLTVIFECYARKIIPVDICREKAFQENLFIGKLYIPCDEQKADRVWKALKAKLHRNNKNMPFFAFLSEEPDIEMKLYRFIRRMFDSKKSIETDYGDQDVLELRKIERKVMQEAMRIQQFVRFQETRDGLFFAPIEPAYNVLPFTTHHFRTRFADQKWLIYDMKRDYGFFYDLSHTHEVVLTEKLFSPLNGKVPVHLAKEEERIYQALWKDYFNQITIKERKNLRMQRQHMPQRYWKFLPEKAQ